MNIFLRPEEAMTEVWQKLVFQQIKYSVLRKLSNLHITKQNEKYPYNIESEYGKEIVQTFQCWEKLEYKMADFENHCRFTLRCLSKDVIPVSVRLKSTINTPKGRYIVRKAERALLNETG